MIGKIVGRPICSTFNIYMRSHRRSGSRPLKDKEPVTVFICRPALVLTPNEAILVLVLDVVTFKQLLLLRLGRKHL